MKYVIEHMEPELSEWASIEYNHMIEWAGKGNIILTHLTPQEISRLPLEFTESVECTSLTIDSLVEDKSRVLLLDPQAFV
jgi:ribosome biogenesis SPOUT family RNA methylase Rps3